MTAVAGCLTPDAVFVGADCRVTWTKGGQEFITDDAAKLIRLGPSSVMGYAGDVQTIAWLLGELFNRQLGQKRVDPVSISSWLPRFMRRTYRALARTYEVGQVEFIVAGSVAGREATVKFSDAEKTVDGTEPHNMSNWLMARLIKVLPHRIESYVRPDGALDVLFVHQAKPDDHFAVPGSSAGQLFAMRSPAFAPRLCPMLGAIAIGTGSDAAQLLRAYEPVLMCGSPERQGEMFLDAMINFLGETRAAGVGGMLLASGLQHGRVRLLSFLQDVEGAGQLSIRTESSRFVVVDEYGRQIVLRWPGEIVQWPSPRQTIVDTLRRVQRSKLPNVFQNPPDMADRTFKLPWLKEKPSWSAYVESRGHGRRSKPAKGRKRRYVVISSRPRMRFIIWLQG